MYLPVVECAAVRNFFLVLSAFCFGCFFTYLFMHSEPGAPSPAGKKSLQAEAREINSCDEAEVARVLDRQQAREHLVWLTLTDEWTLVRLPDTWQHWNWEVQGRNAEATFCFAGESTLWGPWHSGDKIPLTHFGSIFRIRGRGEAFFSEGYSNKAPHP